MWVFYPDFRPEGIFHYEKIGACIDLFREKNKDFVPSSAFVLFGRKFEIRSSKAENKENRI
jgi:hypothetical protein